MFTEQFWTGPFNTFDLPDGDGVLIDGLGRSFDLSLSNGAVTEQHYNDHVSTNAFLKYYVDHWGLLALEDTF